MTTSNVVRGWRNAAKRSGRSAQALRKLVLAGTLSTWKGADGISEFNAADLDALRATLLGPTGAVIVGEIATSATIAASGTNSAPVQLATAPVASNSTGAAIASPSPSPVPGTIAPWLALAASHARPGNTATDATDRDDDETGDDETGDIHCPPFWASSTSLSPWPTDALVPVGVDPLTRRIIFADAPNTGAFGAHTAGTLGAQVTDLQQQVAELRDDLAASAAAVDTANTAAARWRLLYRGLRLQHVGDLVANELVQQRVEAFDGVQYAAQAAVAAVSALPDDTQLAHPGAVDIGREAAARALASWRAARPDQNDETDLDRARDRRAHMRGLRGRRW